MDRDKLMGAYGRAVGLKNSLPSSGVVDGIIFDDYNHIVSTLTELLGGEINSFTLPHSARGGSGLSTWVDVNVIYSRSSQLVSFLEHRYHVDSKIVEIGSLYNSISDTDLKSRCSDLLSATGNFDRVINQATQVLEDRIRVKSGADNRLTGAPAIIPLT